jgi:hypothetical protein
MREFIRHLDKQIEIEEDWKKNIATGALALGLLTGGTNADAAAHHKKQHIVAHKNYSEQEIIRAIAGEAGGSGYDAMLAVASALRNRQKGGEYKHNILKGVAGLNAKHLDTDPKSVFLSAKKAWDESSKIDTVAGATLWGNASDIKKWKANPKLMNLNLLKMTKEVGGNYFFRYK